MGDPELENDGRNSKLAGICKKIIATHHEQNVRIQGPSRAYGNPLNYAELRQCQWHNKANEGRLLTLIQGYVQGAISGLLVNWFARIHARDHGRLGTCPAAHSPDSRCLSTTAASSWYRCLSSPILSRMTTSSCFRCSKSTTSRSEFVKPCFCLRATFSVRRSSRSVRVCKRACVHARTCIQPSAHNPL